MRKNLTKKLFLSVLTLAFAVISLGASTYAWFTLSRNAEVKEFEATVQIGSGLQIQAVAKDGAEDVDAWQTASLTIADNLLEGIVLAACTPGTGEKFTDAITGSEVKGIHDELVGNETAGYVCFDLLFKLTDKNDTKNYNLYFNNYTFATDATATSHPWTVDKAYADKELGDEVFYSVVDAARLRVASKEKQGEDFVIVSNGSVIYEAPDTGDGEYTSGYGNGNNDALEYFNAVNPTNQKTAPTELTGLKNAVDKTTDPNGQKLHTITGGQVYRVTICVWIEGWDGECINAIFKQNLKTTLSFYLSDAQ